MNMFLKSSDRKLTRADRPGAPVTVETSAGPVKTAVLDLAPGEDNPSPATEETAPPVPDHLAAAAASVTSEGIEAAFSEARAPADPMEARMDALEKRVLALEGNHAAAAPLLERAKHYFDNVLQGKV